MAYRVSYGDGMTPGMVNLGDQNTLEAETFATEPEALRRARELMRKANITRSRSAMIPARF